MRELTKSEKKQIKNLLKIGILRRHAEWQNEMSELLNRPFDDEIGNEFDRSLAITDKARKFYKEAMQLEDYYRNSMLLIGLLNLKNGGYIHKEEISVLPEELREWVERF